MTAFAALAWLLPALPALAHDVELPVYGTKVKVRTNRGPDERRFNFKIAEDRLLRVNGHDPRVDPLSLVVYGEGDDPSASGRLTLDRLRWIEKDGKYVYRDRSGSVAGITKAVLKDGRLKIRAKGENWPWRPGGNYDSIWVFVYLEDETYCAEFNGGSIEANLPGLLVARQADPPGACMEQLCGNGVLELSEQCDDGNLDDGDGCNTVCRVDDCNAEEFDTTYEAIQSVIFDNPAYECTNAACHGAAAEGDLDLREGVSFGQLIDVPGNFNQIRVVPGEPDESLLYNKISRKTLGFPDDVGTGMPLAAQALIPDHLDALRLWINGGAPKDKIVEGTAVKLGACLGDPDPLKIPVPDPPPAGAGVQFWQTAWDLPAQFENEICMATYYDLTQTDLVPEEARIPCPERFQQRTACLIGDDPLSFGLCEDDSDCNGEQTCQTGKNIINDTGECFIWNKSTLFQDPQSHHSIMNIYTGRFPLEHPGWTKLTDEQGQEIGQEGWTLKFSDPANPLQGTPCDPTEIDPDLGYNPHCSGSVQETIACLGFGPPDFSNLLSVIGDAGNAPQFMVATEPKLEIALPDQVYDVLPMKGMLVWNSHAFNLTNGDSTMDQYLNLDFASSNEAEHQSIEIFDAGGIFTQKVPPFETREYCKTWTAPKGAHLYRFSSHTHRFGTLFRVWAPPNTPCGPACDGDKPIAQSLCVLGYLPECPGPRDDDPIYASTEYTDPLQLYFDPPIVHEEEDAADRSYLYCALYDNGSAPASPQVKRQSTSPPPPLGSIGELIGGGPCDDFETACTNEPNQGMPCAGEDSVCDSEPGAGDGVCDACPVRGGVTTEDEMFILFGNFFCPGEEPCEQAPF